MAFQAPASGKTSCFTCGEECRSLEALGEHLEKDHGNEETSIQTRHYEPRPIHQHPDDLYETYVRQARKHRLLSRTEERNLARLIRLKRPGETVARRILAESNLKLVIHIVKRYEHRGLPVLDLIQEGNLGLMRAIQKFNPSRGFRFSTYAMWWIQQAIRRALMCSARLVRVPINALELTAQARKTTEVLRQDKRREPDITEVAEAMRKKPGRLEDALRGSAGLHPVSLDGSSRGGGGDQSRPPALITTLVASEKISPPLDPSELRRILDILKPVQKHILIRRFGLDGNPGETLRSLSIRLGLSRERVRQLQAEALGLIRLRRQELIYDQRPLDPPKPTNGCAGKVRKWSEERISELNGRKPPKQKKALRKSCCRKRKRRT